VILERLPFAWRVALLRLRVLILYRWRRAWLSERVPLFEEPDARAPLPPIDTGGAYRAPFRSQFGDHSEDHTSPHSEGVNCTMAAAAMALNHQTGGAVDKSGGHMRHAQGDNDGGTDLYDAADAFASYGEPLSIRSGQGWPKVRAALEEHRGVILQGTGGLAGCGDYSGGHAIYVAPEANGSRWLKGDPECSAYEWCESSALEAWAERLSSGVYFAVTAVQEGDMSRFVQANGYGVGSTKLLDVPAGADWYYLDGSQGGTYGAPVTLRVVGMVDGHPGDWCVIGATGKPYNDGATRTTLFVVTGGEPYDAPPPPAPGDELGARQAQYDADAAAMLGPRPE
jgi:hypothetical protein